MNSRLSHLKNAALAAPLSFPPGHYYSPICDPKELLARYQESPSGELRGIDLNKDRQIARLAAWQPFLSDCQFSKERAPRARYYFGDGCQYPLGDARSLYCFMRELKPQRIIEIGCGFSSACMFDTAEQHALPTRFTFIDPEPATLLSFLSPSDRLRVSIHETPVQDVPIAEFERLEAGDILFIDSTHVLKTCSDVAFELFEVLPRLKPGVFVHFHDIHFPFEYPREWVCEKNYSWNETYALRSLLMFSDKFQIEFWNSYMTTLGHDLGPGGSLWLSISRRPS